MLIPNKLGILVLFPAKDQQLLLPSTIPTRHLKELRLLPLTAACWFALALFSTWGSAFL